MRKQVTMGVLLSPKTETNNNSCPLSAKQLNDSLRYDKVKKKPKRSEIIQKFQKIYETENTDKSEGEVFQMLIETNVCVKEKNLELSN